MITLDERIRPVLESTGFVQRYKKLSEDNRGVESKMENYSNEEVINIANDLGYEINYNRKENFFKLLENDLGLKTQLNISLKYGLVELILDVVKDGERYSVGGPFGMITRLLGEEERVKYPAFSNYNELRSILKEAFSLYSDIRKGLLNR